MAILIPSQGLQIGQSGAFSAPGTVAPRDFTGDQIQGLGRAVEGAGEAAADIGAAIEQDEAIARSQQALNRFNTAAGPLMAEYLAARGEDATGDVPKKLLEKLNGIKRSIAMGLNTDVQRMMFGDKADLRLVEMGRQTAGHYEREVRAFRVGEADSASRMEAAAGVQTALAGDQLGLDRHKSEALKQARLAADGLGMGPRETEEHLLKVTTGIHAGVVSGLLDEGMPDKAREYWQGVDKSEVSPQERGRISATVKRATMNDRAAQMAQSIVAGLTAEVSKPIAPGVPPLPPRDVEAEVRRRAWDELQARRSAGAITEDMRELAWSKVQESAAERRSFEAEHDQNLLLRVEQWGYAAENRLKGLDSMPDADYELLNSRGLLDSAQNILQGRTTGDRAAWLEFMEDMEAGALRDVLPSELDRRFLGRLNPSDMNAARRLHSASLQPDPPPELTDLFGKEEQILAIARKVFILPSGGRAADFTEAQRTVEFDSFRQKLNSMLNAYEMTALGGKRQATAQEREDVFARAAIDWVNVAEGEKADERDEFFFALTPEEQEEATVEIAGEEIRIAAVPASERRLITDAFLRAGTIPTQRMIVEKWVQGGRRR